MATESDKIEVPEWQAIAEKIHGGGHGIMSHVPHRLHEAPPNMAPVIRRLQETHHHLYCVDAFIAKAGGGLRSRQMIAAILYGRGFTVQLNCREAWIDECNQLQKWRQENLGGS